MLSRLATRSATAAVSRTLRTVVATGARAASSSSTTPSAPNAGRYKPAKVTHNKHGTHMPAAIGQLTDIMVDKAAGSYIWGKDGKKYLDFVCGIGVTNLGHCHPKVTKAAHAQIENGVHLQANCVTAPSMIQLTEKMGKMLPPGFPSDYQVLFANSGAEAIENAVKVARQATKRQTVIVFQGGFHGRTIAAGALTTAKQIYRAGYQPSMAGVHVVQYPYCYRCPVSKASEGKCNLNNCCQNPLDELRKMVKQQTAPEEVAAIIVEPLLGEGGYVVPPANFLRDVSAFAKEIGALFVADEVQSGYSRSGTYFACEQFGVVPDLLVCAKGIANGFPLSALVGSADILSLVKPGSVGGTYSGNAVACAAGCEVVDVMTAPGFLENVNARGEQFRKGLRAIADRHPHFMLGDIRGVGLWNAMEWKDHPSTVGVAGRLVKHAQDHGLLLMNTSIYETIRFIPPLTVTEAEMTEALEKLEKAMLANQPQA